LAHEKNIPVVALNDVLFLEKEDHLAHQAKVAINNSTLLKDEIDNPVVSNEQYFKTRDQLSVVHGEEPLNNTIEVAKLCNVFLEEGQYYLPSYEVQEGKTLSEHLEELAQTKLDDYLKNNKKLDKNIYQERLDKELKIII
jgi:DNA polymerase-3 subunit alpha